MPEFMNPLHAFLQGRRYQVVNEVDLIARELPTTRVRKTSYSLMLPLVTKFGDDTCYTYISRNGKTTSQLGVRVRANRGEELALAKLSKHFYCHTYHNYEDKEDGPITVHKLVPRSATGLKWIKQLERMQHERMRH